MGSDGREGKKGRGLGGRKKGKGGKGARKMVCPGPRWLSAGLIIVCMNLYWVK